METLISYLASGVFVTVSLTALLTERLKYWQYILLIVYVSGCAALAGPEGSHIVGLLIIPGALIMLVLMVKQYRVENICMACMGYLIDVFLNNVLLAVIASLLRISVAELIRSYVLWFYAVFFVILFLFMGLLRFLLYRKLHLLRYLEGRSTIRYGLLGNLFLYVVIFLLLISLGQWVGYSTRAIVLNCVLFFLCLTASSILIIRCVKAIRSEENMKAEMRQQELTRSYISGLEYMVDEMSAFRHDYKNILSTMAGFIHENRMDELREFFERQIQDAVPDKESKGQAWSSLRNVEPMELKGFLYEKVLTAMSRNVDVQVDIRRDTRVCCKNMKEIIRILGIFLDNAIEAAEDCDPEGAVYIRLDQTDRGVMIQIENTYKEKPELSKMYEKGWSTKGEGRGNGLYRTKEMIEKQENLYHQCRIGDERVIQRLEIEQQK
mgnify:FL=1